MLLIKKTGFIPNQSMTIYMHIHAYVIYIHSTCFVFFFTITLQKATEFVLCLALEEGGDYYIREVINNTIVLFRYFSNAAFIFFPSSLRVQCLHS